MVLKRSLTSFSLIVHQASYIIQVVTILKFITETKCYTHISTYAYNNRFVLFLNLTYIFRFFLPYSIRFEYLW